MYQVEITAISGPSKGDVFRFPLSASQPISIGRAAHNLLVVADKAAGAEHARIELRGDKVFLVDIGGAEGTWLMGFQVAAGEVGSAIEQGDEFKIGGALFRVSLSKEETAADAGVAREQAESAGRSRLSRNRTTVILGAFAVLLLLFLFWPAKKAAPRQSNDLLHFPQSRVIGFYSDGRGRSDLQHPAQARFVLPGKDQLIEFETLNTRPLNVFVDSAPVMRIPAGTDPLWQKWQLIVPDTISGKRRAFVIENTASGKDGEQPQKWAMRFSRNSALFDIPVAAMPEKPAQRYGELLVRTIEELRGMSGAASGMFNTLRKVQRLIALTLAEQELIGIGYKIDLDRQLPAVEELNAKLEMLQQEHGRKEKELSPVQRDAQLNLLLDLATQLDSELWRLFNNRRAAAMLAARTLNYSEALRHLVLLQNVFPDSDEYRRKEVERMLHDKKVIPKKVLRQKEKYLRQ